jgi:hypothetical protein
MVWQCLRYALRNRAPAGGDAAFYFAASVPWVIRDSGAPGWDRARFLVPYPVSHFKLPESTALEPVTPYAQIWSSHVTFILFV